MYTFIQIFVLIVWAYYSWQIAYTYFKLALVAGKVSDIFLNVTVSTAVLFVLPIFIGTLIKEVF